MNQAALLYNIALATLAKEAALKEATISEWAREHGGHLKDEYERQHARNTLLGGEDTLGTKLRRAASGYGGVAAQAAMDLPGHAIESLHNAAGALSHHIGQAARKGAHVSLEAAHDVLQHLHRAIQHSRASDAIGGHFGGGHADRAERAETRQPSRSFSLSGGSGVHMPSREPALAGFR